MSKQAKPSMVTSPAVMDVRDLADYLKCHRSSIYRLLRARALPGWKLGSDWRFNKEAIDDWMLRGQVNLEGGK